MPQSNNQQFVAIATIFNKKGEILLTQRNSPENPETHLHWQFPGGGIEFGENPDQAIIRELKEEIGLDAKPLSNRPLIFSHTYFEEMQICLITYVFSLESYSFKQDLDEETNDIKWFKLEELAELKSLPQTKEIAEQSFEVFKGLV